MKFLIKINRFYWISAFAAVTVASAGCAGLVDTADRFINNISCDQAHFDGERLSGIDVCTRLAPALTSETQTLHNSLFIADLHADSLLWRRDLRERHDFGHVDLPRLREGNVSLQSFMLVTQYRLGSKHCVRDDDLDLVGVLAGASQWPVRDRGSLFQRAVYQIERLREFAQQEGADRFILVDDSAKLERVRRDGPGSELVGGFIGLEGAHALDGQIENLRALHAKGLRMIGPFHNHNNALGGSSEGCDAGGLTQFGRSVIDEALRLNMVIDVAHASSKSIDEITLKAASAHKPILTSHTGFRTTHRTRRNIQDRHIKAIALTNGVVGVGFWRQAVGALSVEAIADNIQYAYRVLGDSDIVCWMGAMGYDYDPLNHLALGSDFDGAVTVPIDVTGLPHITQALLNRGFKPEEVRKIMGENVARVLSDNWSGTRTQGIPPNIAQLCPGTKPPVEGLWGGARVVNSGDSLLISSRAGGMRSREPGKVPGSDFSSPPLVPRTSARVQDTRRPR